MTIQPGYYKIRIKRGYMEASNHYLRVFIRNQVKYLQIDNGIPMEEEKCEQDIISDYEIVKRLTTSSPIQVNNARITITWQDEHGDSFELNARNMFAFREILKLFPRLARGLGEVGSW